MQVTRKNWSAIAGLIAEHGFSQVDRFTTEEQAVVYSIPVAGMTYTLSADLACDLLIERKLSDDVYGAMVEVGFTGRNGQREQGMMY